MIAPIRVLQSTRPALRDRRPRGDCGLTGRKIIVDTYGGVGRHGGGAFSGKDPSKVDRSAAYARATSPRTWWRRTGRHCEVQLAYAIGVARPVSIHVETFGTAHVAESRIEDLIANHFDLRPKGIVQMLDLLRPIYRKTAANGHFGRDDPDFKWEAVDKVDVLKAHVY